MGTDLCRHRHFPPVLYHHVKIHHHCTGIRTGRKPPHHEQVMDEIKKNKFNTQKLIDMKRILQTGLFRNPWLLGWFPAAISCRCPGRYHQTGGSPELIAPSLDLVYHPERRQQY